MGLSRSEATRWAKIFKVMGDPQGLYMLAVLYDRRDDKISLDELASLAKVSESEARRHLEELEHNGVLYNTWEEDVAFYRFADTNIARKLKRMFERFY